MMNKNDELFSNFINSTIRLSFLAALAIWCLLIFRPFAISTIWGIIIAVGLYPIFQSVSRKIKGRKNIAATIVCLMILTILFIPSYFLADSFVKSSKEIILAFKLGKLAVPAPPINVKTWPLIGESFYSMWELSHNNLMASLSKIGPQLKPIGTFIFHGFTNVGISILQFVLAIIIAGFIFVFDIEAIALVEKVSSKIFGEKGDEFVHIAGSTIRSVARGILGVAFIQTSLAAMGFIFIDLPGAGVWTLLVLIIAIIQVPFLVVFTPIIIYVFTYASTPMAVIFTIWCLIISFTTDPILKPLMLARGLKIPSPIILIGAIGGLFLSGAIGLFVGAVVFSIGYEVTIWWLNGKTNPSLNKN
jgi:predicted PurR-regulated permease PerM